ncbi:hypothetical protein G9A89_014436 [Geosiphon pyriformis]|nr:hypothetical protein G9A89_014436 [Geosiphon pyriformis]
MDKTTIEFLTSTDNTKPKVAESEIIGTNHLGFAKSLFQQYSQQLGLNNNHYSAELAFNFYVNKRITNFLGRPRKFLFRTDPTYQLTNSFAPIIREINQEIERYTQKTFSITYQNKGKRKLQTPAVTPKGIQIPNWKKQRIEFLIYPSYHYMPGSTINITSVDVSISTKTPLARIAFQNFGTVSSWEITESEEKEDENQKFNYQNPLSHQQNLPPPISKPIQPPQVPLQQSLPLQQLQQQPPQSLNLDLMAYTPITKLDNFTAIQAIPYFLKDTTNLWYQSLINKSQDFNAFKVEFLRYFSNNNSINHLVNTFTTIKQGEMEVITTYLECFHQNLRQIQAIDANYFTVPQILNQFIHGLYSSILQHICLLHSGTLQDAVTRTRDFESVKSEANYAQAVNLVINESSKLDSKLEKFSESINKKLEEYLADNHETQIISKINHVHYPRQHLVHHGSQKHVSVTTVVNKAIFELIAILRATNDREINTKTPIATTNLLTTSISNSSLSTAATSNLSIAASSNLSAAVSNNLSVSTINSNTTPKLSYDDIRKPETQNCSKLEIGDGCLSTDLQFLSPKLRILFSEFRYCGAALEKKPITAMYTDVKVDGYLIKLILDSSSAGSIITQQLMNQLSYRVNQAASAHIITADGTTKIPIGEIDDFPFEVNSIITPIKVLVMDATQYQALVSNDWLSKTNAILDWTTQELQLSDNGQHTRMTAKNGKMEWYLVSSLHLEGYPYDEDEIWRMAYAMSEDATTEELREIKDNPLLLSEPEYVQMFNIFDNIENDTEKFHEHYQQLAPTREEQEECLAQLNTRLCDHCLIPCDFQYCNKCDLIYNRPPHMIYTIPEKEEPISSCTLELELPLDSDSNSDNDDDNNGSSSIQNGNDNDNDSNSDPNSNTNYKQYIALPDLSKKQELKWYSDKEEGIMPEHAHDTNAGFDLRYPEKDAIKLEPYSHTCIDLKVALEIPTTTIVQLASRSSLAKRGINIRGGIIDMRYIENIIAMLQNNSEKAYIIEPNEKIAQTIFLPLMKIAQLVLVGNREELGITAREIQGFRSMGRIEIFVNMAKAEIVGQRKIISTGQAISIPPYSQYMLAIGRKEKKQEQIFEAEANLCELGEIGLINLHIPAKSYSSIKFSFTTTLAMSSTYQKEPLLDI